MSRRDAIVCGLAGGVGCFLVLAIVGNVEIMRGTRRLMSEAGHTKVAPES